MRFVLEVYIDCEDMDDATLEMYVASQIMGGPIECTVVCAATEIDVETLTVNTLWGVDFGGTMAKSKRGGRRRDPTADAALARCFKQGLPVPQVDLEKMKRKVNDGDRIFVIWVRHFYRDIPTRNFMLRWRKKGSFITWLEREGVIYRKHEIITED